MTTSARTHPLLVTTTHIDELREKCASLASEARDGAVSESKGFTEALVDEQVTALQQNLEEQLRAMQQRLDNGLAELRARLDSLFDIAKGAAPRKGVDELARELRSGLADTKAAVAREGQARASLGSKVEALRSETTRANEALASVAAQQREESQRHATNLESLRQATRTELDDRAQGLEGEMAQVRGELGAKVDSIEGVQLETLERRFEAIVGRLQALESDARGIESLPTRRVEWLLPNVSQLERSGRGGEKSADGASRSWWSPKFMVAGQGELQLELKLFREGEAGGAGDCVLQLWGCNGCRSFEAVVKLYVGNTVEELQHRVVAGHAYAMRRCPWRGAVDPADDTLRVGVEVVEGFQLLGGLRPEAPGADREAAAGPAGPAPAGCLGLYRHLCPSAADRVALLQEQWDGLRSRMVGRVEWRLEQVLMLQQCFPKGECLCSAMFSAGGFEHLQLVFYPSGDDDARACYCSFFLFCPGHTALQCWLSVGKQRRESHRQRCKPDFTGRSNFCLFEGAVDRGTDTLNLVLEIAEAQQHGGDSSKPTPKAVPWPALANPSVLESEQGQEAAAAAATYEDLIQNSSKLQGVPGRISLEDAKQLPALWTPRPGTGVSSGGSSPSHHLPPVWVYKPRPTSSRGLPEGFLKLSELPGAPPASAGRRTRPRDTHTPRGRGSSQTSKSLPPSTMGRQGTAGSQMSTPPTTAAGAG